MWSLHQLRASRATVDQYRDRRDDREVVEEEEEGPSVNHAHTHTHGGHSALQLRAVSTQTNSTFINTSVCTPRDPNTAP